MNISSQVLSASEAAAAVPAPLPLAAGAGGGFAALLRGGTALPALPATEEAVLPEGQAEALPPLLARLLAAAEAHLDGEALPAEEIASLQAQTGQKVPPDAEAPAAAEEPAAEGVEVEAAPEASQAELGEAVAQGDASANAQGAPAGEEAVVEEGDSATENDAAAVAAQAAATPVASAETDVQKAGTTSGQPQRDTPAAAVSRSGELPPAEARPQPSAPEAASQPASAPARNASSPTSALPAEQQQLAAQAASAAQAAARQSSDKAKPAPQSPEAPSRPIQPVAVVPAMDSVVRFAETLRALRNGVQQGERGPALPALGSTNATAAGAGGGEASPSFGSELLAGRPTLAGGMSEARSLPPAPMPASAPLPEQMSLRIRQAVSEGQPRLTVQLNPAELGRVDVRLEFTNEGTLRALITADRPEALDMLQRDARGLERALSDAGLKTDSQSLSFDLREQNQQRGEQQRASARAGDGEPAQKDETQPEGSDSPAGTRRGLLNLSV